MYPQKSRKNGITKFKEKLSRTYSHKTDAQWLRTRGIIFYAKAMKKAQAEKNRQNKKPSHLSRQTFSEYFQKSDLQVNVMPILPD